MSAKVLPLVGLRQSAQTRKRLYLEEGQATNITVTEILDALVLFTSSTAQHPRGNQELKAFAQAVELGLLEIRGLVRAQGGYLGAAWSAGEQIVPGEEVG